MTEKGLFVSPTSSKSHQSIHEKH